MRPDSRIRIAPYLIILNVYPTDNISKWSRCWWTCTRPSPRIRRRIEDTPWPYLPTMCCVLMMWQWDHVTIYIRCVEMVWQYTMYIAHTCNVQISVDSGTIWQSFCRIDRSHCVRIIRRSPTIKTSSPRRKFNTQHNVIKSAGHKT